MSKQRKQWLALLVLLIVAATFRIAVAHWLASDAPDDGKTYALIARDVVEQHVYSQATEPPYDPTMIRAPGYPLFLAAIYSVFGHTNNGAVRIVQALIDTGTCALVALLAFLWQPDEKRKLATAIAALALAAVNPFTTIYAGTILAEVPTTFLAVAMCVAATIAARAANFKRSLGWWCCAGILAGLGALFRPDSGLFAIAVCLALLIASAFRFRGRFPRAFISVSVFSVALMLVLAPWTLRNWRVFHLFQPLAPMRAEMPDEFVPRGYIRWLKTWLDDQRYIDEFWWELDVAPINVDDLPDTAFDSAGERGRVSQLLDRYNHPANSEAANSDTQQPQPSPTPTPQSSPTPKASNSRNQAPKSANSNANQNSAGDDKGDQNDNSNDNSNDQGDEADTDEKAQTDQDQPEQHGPVKMTSEIDQAFGQIAAERIARHPIRYYFWVPAKRAKALWFNTHSDLYPFEGVLFPLDELDYEAHQQLWLPLFAALVAMYTLLGIAGAVGLWKTNNFHARSVVLLAALIVFTRLGFFSSVESPEPRYVVELFPFLAALGGIAIALIIRRLRPADS